MTQRLKRMDTIKDKLQREPEMSLGRMQDFGGCRVVLPSVEAVRSLQRRIVTNHRDARVKDYIAQPRDSGYRSVHIIAEYGQDPRKQIEIQLRTVEMHFWAVTVEEMSSAMGHNYKQDGNSPFQAWARSWADLIFGDRADPGLQDAHEQKYRQLITSLRPSEPT